MTDLFKIIFEDSDLLVLHKPAGLVCHPTKGDAYSSLISRVRLYLGLPTEASAHIINRLDRETSGIIITAKNAAAAGELGKLWESRAVVKEYQAIVHGHLYISRIKNGDLGTFTPETSDSDWIRHGLIHAPLGKDTASIVAVKDCVRPDGALAQTEFWIERRFFRPTPLSAEPSPFSLLRVAPRTGRKHQIRIHLSHIGHPIVGDKLYGNDEDCYLALAQNRLTDEQRQKLILPNQALHARSLRFRWRGEEKIFTAEPERTFTDFTRNPATIDLPGLKT